MVDKRTILFDNLFRPYCEVALPNGASVYLRVLSDAEIRLRDMAAISVSNKAKKIVLKEGSDENTNIIEPLKEFSRTDMINLIKAVRVYYINLEVARLIQEEYIPLPFETDVTGEARRDVEDKRGQERIDTYRARQDEVNKRIVELEKELDALSDAELLERCINDRVLGFTNASYNDEAKAQLVYLCSYKDDSFRDRFFQNVDTVRELNPRLKALLEETYYEIDVDLTSLKN